MNMNREAETGQTRLRPGSDCKIKIDGPFDMGRGLPEAFWPRVLALWGYAATPPFFAVFRNRAVR